MSFLPDWWSQGTTAYSPESKFGQAGMFDKPTAQQQGDFGAVGRGIGALVNALRSDNQNPVQVNDVTPAAKTNTMPMYTPYQGQEMGPNMGQVNNPYAMSPNGSIFPNWNRNNGGY